MFEGFDDFVRERYASAVVTNGDLEVCLPAFKSHLKCIVARHFSERKAENPKLLSFALSLHTDDLLLALACAQGSNVGWERLSSLYRKYLADLSHRLIGRGFDAQDLSDAIWIDLFLPDRSGQSRIASYDGRSSLATWLRVIVSNRVVNERLRKGARFTNLDGVPEPADSNALHTMEAQLHLNRYRSKILQCFRRVSLGLSPRDRLVLLLRFDQELQLGEIARLFSVHQSTITRQIDRILARIRNDMLALLASEYKLGPEAIQECLGVAFEALSRSVSIVMLLKSVVVTEESESTSTSKANGCALAALG